MVTLGLLAIALILIIIFQIARASELLSEVKNGQRSVSSRNNIHANLFLAFLVVGMIGAFWSAIYYAPMYLPEPSSEHGVWLRDMFFWTLVATVPVFVITHIMLFYFAFKYKHDDDKISKFYPDDNRLELIWTLVPAVVMVLLVTIGIVNWNKITSPPSENAIVIEATGQQFYWTLRYAGADNKLGTKHVRHISANNPMGQNWDDPNNNDDFLADELHLPLNQEVIIKINSMDVLHNFFLPHMRVKMDAVPGIPTQFKFTATKTTEQMREELGNPDFNYELACAELCGPSHYNMRKVVIVETEEEFNNWLKEQEPISKSFGPKAAVGNIDLDKQDETTIVSLNK